MAGWWLLLGPKKGIVKDRPNIFNLLAIMEAICTFSYLKNKVVLVSIFVLISLDVTISDTWEAKEFSNPKTDLQECRRKGKQSFVCDPDGIITSKEGMYFG